MFSLKHSFKMVLKCYRFGSSTTNWNLIYSGKINVPSSAWDHLRAISHVRIKEKKLVMRKHSQQLLLFFCHMIDCFLGKNTCSFSQWLMRFFFLIRWMRLLASEEHFYFSTIPRHSFLPWPTLKPFNNSHLHLLERNLKAEGLVVVRIQSVLLHRRLLLLQPLSILQQVDFHIGIYELKSWSIWKPCLRCSAVMHQQMGLVHAKCCSVSMCAELQQPNGCAHPFIHCSPTASIQISH